MNIEFDDFALQQAMDAVASVHGKKISAFEATTLICTYLEWLNSDDRDFSDEMLQARETFAKLTGEQPEECPSKLWGDALQSVGKM